MESGAPYSKGRFPGGSAGLTSWAFALFTGWIRLHPDFQAHMRQFGYAQGGAG